MKNKLLVFAFAAAAVTFAFTSCETKPSANVKDVCGDMIKESITKSARSLLELDGQTLTISEYDFIAGLKSDQMVYRTITFGNGAFKAKAVDTLTYEFGSWSENNKAFSLLITPRKGEPYTLVYSGNSFITPDGRWFGGEGSANTARVEKWEKTMVNFPNNEWEGEFKDKLVIDSVLEDSVKVTFIPPMTFRYDTIKIWKGKIDTLNADTTCYFHFNLDRNPSTLANTGHFYKKSVRSKYDKKNKTLDIISVNEKEYDCTWYFSDVTSDAKFSIILESTTAGVKGDTLNISKYKLDDAGNAHEFLMSGVTLQHPAVP